jgi:acyl-coenzyme A synthetase/AMP-(fatty) acid ligase
VAVEDRLNDHPATTAAIAVPVVDDETHDQRIAMIYVGEAIDRNELRDWIAPILGSIATPSSIHQVDGFISTVSGKVDRRATASQLGLTVDEPDNEELA